jgi:hypothetical protein
LNDDINKIKICFFSSKSNEDKARKMEKAIVDLVDESCLAYEKNDTKLVGKIYSIN